MYEMSAVTLYTDRNFTGSHTTLGEGQHTLEVPLDVVWSGNLGPSPWISTGATVTGVRSTDTPSFIIFGHRFGRHFKMVGTLISDEGVPLSALGTGRYYPSRSVPDPPSAEDVTHAWNNGNTAPVSAYRLFSLTSTSPSVDVMGNYSVTLYRAPDLTGPKLGTTTDILDVLDRGWNYPIKSVHVIDMSPTSTPSPCGHPGMYSDVQGAIVSIYVRNPGWVGSGFVYQHNNGSYYIVTAAHVVMNSSRTSYVTGPIYASVPTADGVVAVTCNVVGVAGTADVAVLTFSGATPKTAASFAPECPPPGTCVAVLGDPMGIDSISVSEGVVRDSQYIFNNIIPCSIVESVSITCSVFGGNSGSGVFDSTGHVVGLVSYGSGETFSWGATVPYFQTIVDDIISSNGNFIGKTLNATMVMLDMWVRAQYNITNPDLQGIYIVSSSTSGLPSGSVITHIEGQPVGLYQQYRQVTPMQLYMRRSNTIQVTLENGSTVAVPLIDMSSGEDTPLFSTDVSAGTETVDTQSNRIPPFRRLSISFEK